MVQLTTVYNFDSSAVSGVAPGKARCQLYSIPATCTSFHLGEPQVPHVTSCKMASESQLHLHPKLQRELDEEADVNIVYKLLSASTLER